MRDARATGSLAHIANPIPVGLRRARPLGSAISTRANPALWAGGMSNAAHGLGDADA